MPVGKPGTVIIGIGNQYRGDDAIGLVVAQRLKANAPHHVTVLEQNGDGVDLMEEWRDAEEVILVDAISSGSSPGGILKLDVTKRSLPKEISCRSSHSFGVAEAVELARALERLPAKLIIYGVEGKSFEIGMSLSHEVAQAAERLAGMIIEEAEREEVGRYAEDRVQPTSPP